jgi:hypothetical protein
MTSMICAGLGPEPPGLGGELHAHAEHRVHAHGLGALDDQRQLAGHLHHEDALEPELGGVQAEVDELLVLVAVAHEHGLGVPQHAHGRDELGLAARLQAVVILLAVPGDGLHHLLLLVHLDGVGPQVGSMETQGIHGLEKGLVEQGDLRVEDVLDAQEHGQVEPALLDAGDDLRDAQGALEVAGLRRDEQFPLLRDAEIPRAPFAHAVEFGGPLGGPPRECMAQCSPPPRRSAPGGFPARAGIGAGGLSERPGRDVGPAAKNVNVKGAALPLRQGRRAFPDVDLARDGPAAQPPADERPRPAQADRGEDGGWRRLP